MRIGKVGLLAGAAVGALALAACSTNQAGQPTFDATAILGTGGVNGTNNKVVMESDSTTDPSTTANVTYNTNGTPGLNDDSVVIAVTNGGHVTGPATYT